MRSRLLLPVVLALPGLSLAVAGLFHHHHLDASTAERWWHLHVLGLLVFPLVGVALIVLMRGRRDAVSWLVRLTAYVYMTVYGALDVIDGIGAGYLTYQDAGNRDLGANQLFTLGTDYERYGSWALIAAAIAVTVDQVVRHRWAGAPVVLMVAGAWLVHVDHIFSPHGVQGMVLIGLSTGYAAWNAGPDRLRAESSSRPGATNGSAGASLGVQEQE